MPAAALVVHTHSYACAPAQQAQASLPSTAQPTATADRGTCVPSGPSACPHSTCDPPITNPHSIARVCWGGWCPRSAAGKHCVLPLFREHTTAGGLWNYCTVTPGTAVHQSRLPNKCRPPTSRNTTLQLVRTVGAAWRWPPAEEIFSSLGLARFTMVSGCPTCL
jgi:hypothetical protein